MHWVGDCQLTIESNIGVLVDGDCVVQGNE